MILAATSLTSLNPNVSSSINIIPNYKEKTIEFYKRIIRIVCLSMLNYVRIDP